MRRVSVPGEGCQVRTRIAEGGVIRMNLANVQFAVRRTARPPSLGRVDTQNFAAEKLTGGLGSLSYFLVLS
jgi:hypothetical protein